MRKKIKIGITIGDINGIGPEVIIKALSSPNITDYFIPIIYGSAKVIAYHKNIVGANNFQFVSIKHPDNAAHNKINVFNVWDETSDIELGQATKDGGKFAMLALQQAVSDAKEGLIQAIVTAPINKNAMKLANFEHVGHTEYFTQEFEALETVMTMVSDSKIIALASNHVPVSELNDALDKKKIIRKLKVLTKALKQDFGFERPTIAVLGLNPHAGDDGVIGNDEEAYIKPAIKEAKNNGVIAAGPYPADGFFGSNQFQKFDAILAMYHDQGLIPFKLLSFGSGVNVTAGLPIIRTSPDHGTAYGIAGRNEANPESMRKAIFLAKELYLNRARYSEDSKNAMKKAPKFQEEVQE
ncbi:MAG: 4-hydroxythreonine-4-phosphate dehydrogenase PdxA [Saprospiraceae bacterium]|nr:4-hydroxythreonine-4-phosphate dehydrogenase PdxA [Bacteroidia bacterium]NNE15464.1 4-hydroxythreonine-4-phosphate dehydrogenase PdxA [Saprospiraceae bacterium]NNL92421.1 4-hydroxythreonine-4-phosphate dehydrogenase PdxA [Saprospiraceae bacterium]